MATFCASAQSPELTSLLPMQISNTTIEQLIGKESG
jgi:hypothetical protein